MGTNTATCLLSHAALNAARMATSVFPKPTSPQTSRSIGRSRSISAFTSCVAFSWSGVSSYKKLASKACCKNESTLNANPFSCLLLAYSLIKSRAMSLIRFFVRSFIRSHAPVPSVERRGACSVSPRLYLLIL